MQTGLACTATSPFRRTHHQPPLGELLPRQKFPKSIATSETIRSRLSLRWVWQTTPLKRDTTTAHVQAVMDMRPIFSEMLLSSRYLVELLLLAGLKL